MHNVMWYYYVVKKLVVGTQCIYRRSGILDLTIYNIILTAIQIFAESSDCCFDQYIL